MSTHTLYVVDLRTDLDASAEKQYIAEDFAGTVAFDDNLESLKNFICRRNGVVHGWNVDEENKPLVGSVVVELSPNFLRALEAQDFVDTIPLPGHPPSVYELEGSTTYPVDYFALGGTSVEPR